jgi:predicted phosphodiesterase
VKNEFDKPRMKALLKYKWLFFGLIVLFSLITWVNAKPHSNNHYAAFQPSPADHQQLAFVSDTQDPMWVEKVYLKENHNTYATQLIFKEITALNPLALFNLGDVISLSAEEERWATMDKYLAACRQTGTKVYGVLGNHDVMYNPGEGMRNFQKRFPEHINTGYTEVVDSIAVVLLNSNFKELTKLQVTAQQDYLAERLAALDKDSSVRYVVVCCHHSPYSNSKIVGSSIPVQQQFVPLFMKSKKAKVFISGHSHNFEYFKHEGKDFLVIGGGGGLYQPLNTGPDKLPDLAPNYKPSFHYLKLKLMSDHLQIQSRRLKEDFSGFEDGYTLNVQ